MSDVQVKKAVLAYSGGLDTSIIVPWLRETYGCEVICFCADIGQGEELEGLEAKARASGASKLVLADLRRAFAAEFLFPLIQSGAIYEGQYLLGTSIARPLIAAWQVRVAEAEGADAVAHGCTGKGNDQVRFELTYKALNPALKVIAPWREWSIRSREQALDYAQAHQVPVSASLRSIYSRDRNLWHLSHEGGPLEDPAQEPEPGMYQWTVDPGQAPDQALELEIGFEQGVPVTLDGQALDPAALVGALNELGARHAIGRVDLVENRLVGMKSRGVYETPGGTILWHAHRELESLCLDRDLAHYKQHVALEYARLVYDGKWFTPLREALQAFIRETQQSVSGSVRLKLYKGNVIVVGRASDQSLYREDFATFAQDEVYNQRDAEGFINLFGLPLKVRALRELALSDRTRQPVPLVTEIQRD
jgi:argininosuccinate synthase